MDQFNLLNCSLFLLIFLFFLKFLRNKKLNLPPSPPKLPIIGNLHQLGKIPHRSLRSLSEKYGPLMFFNLGWTPTLVVSSAEMAREVLKTHDINTSNRPKSITANLLLYGCKEIGFAPHGDHWREMKKLTGLELLSQKRIHELQYVKEEELERLLSKVRKAISTNSSVNLSELIALTINNIVTRCVIGEKFEDENGKSKFGEMTKQMAKSLLSFSLGDIYPGFEWVDYLTNLIGKLKETARTSDLLLEQLITQRKGKKSDNKDFLDILLQVQEKADSLDFKLSHDSLKALLLELILAGTFSTTSTLEWVAAELMRNPTLMKKAQEEVRRVVGDKSNIDATHISQMNYLKCVIKESLRLHPPGPLLLPRVTTKTISLGGYIIPPKTRVFVNAFAIHTDPKIWENPDEFIPERFINNPIDFKGEDYQYIPFGGGRRMCPGINFALPEIDYVLANLLQWFDWKLPDVNMNPKDLDMAEDIGLALNKKFPLIVKPTPYSI